MKPLSYVRRGILSAALFLSAAAALPSGQANQAAMVKQSDIVFAGTVSQTRAVSFADIPQSSQTIVVRVDSVLKKPAAVSLKRGDDVTVEVKDPSAFQPGTQAMFYTQGWIFGSGVAVKELGHEIKPGGEAAVAATGGGEAAFKQFQKQISDQDLQDRLNSADAVVVGRVTDVHPWTNPTLASTHPHITEHDPNWQEAVIQVQSAIKGAGPEQKMVVRFPGSYDVAWVNAPKFKKDQEGTFFLKKDQVTGSPRALLAGSKVTAYTALRAGDVLSTAEADRVRSLLNK